ncbi:hypothetical protein G7Z98_09300 [Pseudomonas stutzeri]|nr:hypothetical protein [Stutzerimonas stutzeri]
MSKEVRRYTMWQDGSCSGPQDEGDWVTSEDYDALLAERDRLRDALYQIENANWSSSETATNFAISQAKGLLIGKMKRIAAAALQGEQP